VLVGKTHPSTVKSEVPKLKAESAFVFKYSPLVPLKYPLPPYSAVVYDAVGENGWNAWTRGVPLGVITAGALLLSMNRFDWQVKSFVWVPVGGFCPPEITPRGAVGTVMVEEDGL
jgi:hypothetical protein